MDPSPGAPERDSPLGPRGLVIVASGLLLHAVVCVVLNTPTPRALQGDEIRYRQEAISIAAGAFPPPEFLWPPLQKWFLGAVTALFGPGLLPVGAIQSLLFVASALLLRRVVLRLGLGAVAADTAMGFFLLDPQVGAFALFLWPETVHLFLLLAALALLTSSPAGGSWRDGAGGLCLGLALLAKSLVGPFVPVLLGGLVVAAAGEPLSRRLLRGVGVGAAVLAVVAPVVVWNGVQHGYWGVASSGAFNAWVGLNDPPSRTDYDSVAARSYWEYQASGRTPGERNRATMTRIEKKVAGDGPGAIVARQLAKQYVRLLDRNSFFTDMLPGGRFRPSGRPTGVETTLRLWAWGIWGITLVLAGPGLFLACRQGTIRATSPVLLFLLYNLGIFLFLHVKTRYRLPFVPCLDLYAGIAVSWAAARWAREPGASSPDGRIPFARLAGGAVLSLALLGLAFGGVGS